MNFTETGSYTYNGETKEYHYSPTATYMEQVAFVNGVTSTVITDSGYMPLLKDVVFNLRLVQMFTDIDMSQFNDDDGLNLDMFAKFDEETGMSEYLKLDLFDSGLTNALIKSVDDNIAYKTGIRRDGITESIVDLINTVKDRLATWGEGLTAEDALDFIDKFKQSGINGENIVKTYLDSDNYKKNVLDVVDSKNADIKERDARIADLKQKLNDVTAKNVLADKSDKVIPIKGE